MQQKGEEERGTVEGEKEAREEDQWRERRILVNLSN